MRPVERVRLDVEDRASDHVTAVAHRPARAPAGRPVLLTHGAGGDLDGAGLIALCEALAEHGHLAVRANLPYREARSRGGPPRADRALPGYASLVAAVESTFGEGPWVLGGKSYGGRVASLAVADSLVAAHALLFYGYPLHPPRREGDAGSLSLRVDHWPRITVPCLFLQGARDPFCDLEALEAHRGELGGPSRVEVVEGGDHSLKITRRAAPDGVARGEAESLARLGDAVAGWIAARRAEPARAAGTPVASRRTGPAD